MDDIRIGYGVYSGGAKVGEVARLVADAGDSHVTDIVVDRGLLHGAKLVPLEDLADVSAGRVQLKLTHDQFLKADGFVDQRFRGPHDGWSVPHGYDPSDFLLDAQIDVASAAGFGATGMLGGPPPSPADPRPNLLRPFIKDGTPVRSSTGAKLGEIAQVSFNPEDGHLDSLTIRRGLMGREHVDLPLDWIDGFNGDGLVLHVSEVEVQRLPVRS
jgi:uncharacterized protein YrrD